MSKPAAIFVTIAALTAAAMLVLGTAVMDHTPQSPSLVFDHVLELCTSPEACGAGLLKRLEFTPQHATCECQNLAVVPIRKPAPRSPAVPQNSTTQLAGPPARLE